MLSRDRDYGGFTLLTFAPIVALFAKQNRRVRVDPSLASPHQTQGHNQRSPSFLWLHLHKDYNPTGIRKSRTKLVLTLCI